MTAFETDILAQLIRAKRECLLQLRELGRRQLDLIDADDITSLLDILAAKQRPLVQLQRIERALDPFRNQDPEQRRWRSLGDRCHCAEQVQQCETLLGEIVSQERCSEGSMVRRRDEAAQRLQGAHLAGQACGAYTDGFSSHVSQLDLHSDT